VHLGLCLRFLGDVLLERGDRTGAEQVWRELRELAEVGLVVDEVEAPGPWGSCRRPRGYRERGS